MALNRALSWYQHKISVYDKQIWEETVEQRIIHGLTHVPKKSGKLKLEYIDLDLVRGSSFPKAKPKHGLVYISQICIVRLLFLPFYRHWWIRQTSAKIFKLLLLLYFFQILNMIIYLTRPNLLAVEVASNGTVQNSTITTETPESTPIDVTAEEVLVPGVMMCILSFLLSQIGSTYTGSNKSPFKPRNKVRIKRAKRKLSRRIGNVPSDSKSSLDNVEQPVQDSAHAPEIKPGLNLNRRSLSEERNSPRMKIPQRSSSLQLESNHTLMPHLASKAPVAAKNVKASASILKRNSWQNFFAWSGRFVGSKRTLNEDEGFDSFHGNNSSSSDCDTEDKSKKIQQEQSGTAPGSENVTVEDFGQENEATDETCASETSEDKKNTAIGAKRIEVIAVEGVDDPPLLRRRRNLPVISLKLIPPEETNGYVIQSESETEPARRNPKSVTILSTQRRGSSSMFAGESSYQSSCESDGDGHSSLASPSYKLSEPSTPLDWTGVTTNSEECSYSSESRSESDDQESNRFPNVGDFSWSDELTFAWDYHGGTSAASSSDKISCTVWEGLEVKKADLSVLDVAATIIAKVDVMPESTDYLYGGLVMAAIFSLLPILYRINGAVGNAILACIRAETIPKILESVIIVCNTLLGSSKWEKLVVITAALERFAMAAFFLFLLAVAERTFKQRFLYAKLFSHVTSSRRARNSDLPHFRLNKVRNIKTWLSVRSYLKKRGPQRSVDCIVSTAFIVTLCLVSFLCMELLKESQYLHQSLYNLEVLCWCLVLGVFLLRFMTLGSKINKKYRNLSVLITEQINLYLQMEQKPHKKEELMLANNVLKLAADLLKELESPFKISGLSANPYLYNLTKVVVLSALSGVLSEMLGFKLKLHKIKIR